ncbi:MAG: hypothetical protein ACM3N7_06130 [Planctomycetaceae bacterium]
MKTSSNTQILGPMPHDPGMGGMFFVSLFLHLAAVSAVFFIPNLSSQRTYYSPVYSVRLVSVQPALPAVVRGEPKKESLPPVSAPPAEKPKPKEKEKPISLAAKPKEDTSKV